MMAWDATIARGCAAAAVWAAPAGAPPRYFAVRVPVMLGWTVQTKP